MGPGDVVVAIDLRGARPGRRFIQLTSDQVRGPLGMDVMQLNPSSLAVVLEKSATREVPIVPAVEGLPARGFAIGKTTAEPATAEIVGPESVIKRATEAVTEPVSIAGAKAAVSEIVTVGLRDTSLRLKNPRPVTVTVQIVRAPIERSSAQD
jgi:YbbR domain-containing protein